MSKQLILILTLCSFTPHLFGQVEKSSLPDSMTVSVPPTGWIPEPGNCKSVITVPVWVYEYMPVTLEPVQVLRLPTPPPKPIPFLQVHGNILYNVNYYSAIDTPYNEQDVYHHTIQTYLDILIKGRYPLRLYLTNRFSNSSLFRDFSDINFSFNNALFKQQLKDTVRKIFLASLPTPEILSSLQQKINRHMEELRRLDNWIKNPALLQKMVEERERQLKGLRSAHPSVGVSHLDSLMKSINTDSLSIKVQYTRKKLQADSIRNTITSLQQDLRIAYQQSRNNIGRIVREIEQADNPEQLKYLMHELQISDSVLPKGYKTLMAIRSFGIGRSVVNYSELSAKNISINGLQAEYNPAAYYAIAAGKIDYRFRNFIVRNPGQSGQGLFLLRYGRGQKNYNNIILTWYTGRRQLYNAGTIDTLPVHMPAAALMGFTIEGNYRLTENIQLTAEVAKSSVPGYSNQKGSLADQLFRMSTRDNEAYSLKVHARFPKTATLVQGSLKRLGASFQSFSTFTDGSAQTAWSARLQQPFFKKQLTVMLGAQTNDFSNPFIGAAYRSTTVFKSVQATWRKRNWPVISVGYFPSSQITRLGNGHLQENIFHTLTGNVTYAWQYGPALMNSTLVYSRFYNRAADSGFVYFNTRNLLFSQSVFLQQFTLQCNAAGALNQDYALYTLEGKVQYNVNKYMNIGAGIKYNKQTVFDIEQLGYSAEANLQLPSLGQFQVSADKGFLPGMNRQLVPNNTGRVTYFKTF